MFKVLIPEDIAPKGKEYLVSKGFDVEVLSDCSVENICRNVVDADAILARTTPYPAEIFHAAKQLKVIARYGAGFDNIDLDAASKAGVQICNTPTANSNSVAEHAIGLMIACASQLLYQDHETRQGHWNVRNTRKRTELRGKTLGLIGCGHIGQLTAEKAHLGFGMPVIGYDAFADPAKIPEYINMKETMTEIFENADVISLHIPATAETKGSVDKNMLELMKPDSILINCARGGIVNEADLNQCMKDNTFRTAGLDVFEQEPALASNPLFNLENVIVTPHSGALTYEAMEQMGLDAAAEIERVLLGQKPKWAVNRVTV